MSKLQIETLVLGQVGTNCYLIKNRESGELLIVDPADDGERIGAKICDMEANPVAILLTHGHFDHIGAAAKLREKYDIHIYAMAAEQEVLENDRLNLSRMFGYPLTLQADVLLQDGQELALAGCRIRVFHTPGHTQGGACYYFPEEGCLFSGDTLFCESVGRSDFPTGNMSVLARSVREKLLVLPETTEVFPGHNCTTDIGHEKQFNPFIGAL